MPNDNFIHSEISHPLSSGCDGPCGDILEQCKELRVIISEVGRPANDAASPFVTVTDAIGCPSV